MSFLVCSQFQGLTVVLYVKVSTRLIRLALLSVLSPYTTYTECLWLKQSSGWYNLCFLPTPVFGLPPDDGTAVFFWRVFQGGMGVAALYRWLSRWQEIHLVWAFRIYCAHTKSAFLAHIACLIRCRLIRFMAGSFTADLYRYWAFEASRKFTSCLHTCHNTALLSIPDRWQLSVQVCLHPTGYLEVMWKY